MKSNKNDDRDAEAIAEAATRPTMRFVPVKNEVQSDIQALHRARSRLVAERTALINQLRALLLERGIVMAQGRRKLEASLAVLADEDDRRSPRGGTFFRTKRFLGDPLRRPVQAEAKVLDIAQTPEACSSTKRRSSARSRAIEVEEPKPAPPMQYLTRVVRSSVSRPRFFGRH